MVFLSAAASLARYNHQDIKESGKAFNESMVHHFMICTSEWYYWVIVKGGTVLLYLRFPNCLIYENNCDLSELPSTHPLITLIHPGCVKILRQGKQPSPAFLNADLQTALLNGRANFGISLLGSGHHKSMISLLLPSYSLLDGTRNFCF